VGYKQQADSKHQLAETLAKKPVGTGHGEHGDAPGEPPDHSEESDGTGNGISM